MQKTARLERKVTATYLYTYDNAGNILSKQECALTAAGVTPNASNTATYTYGNENWGDQLTSFKGNSITYDEIGNPLSYHNGTSRYNFTWQYGRRLATAQIGLTIASYEYDGDGIRTSKTINNIEHIYTLDGTKILSEAWGDNLLLYIYDESGAPVGFQYRNSTYGESEFDVFIYEKNLQGDIVAIYNEAGVKLASYLYDAWGKVSVAYSNGGANTAAAYNPFKYRGYYHDSETGFYYLNSRYYDPATCRFINADGFISTGQGILGNNMYAYCGNNPISRKDINGLFWNEIWEFFKTAVAEIGKSMQDMSPVYAGCVGVAAGDGILPFGDAAGLFTAAVLTTVAIVCGVYRATSISISQDAAGEKEKDTVHPPYVRNPVIFPVDPYNFNPRGLVMVEHPGTKNGRLISWMDPATNTEIFRWDENSGFKNGPHYHVFGEGHYKPGIDFVPPPLDVIYFP